MINIICVSCPIGCDMTVTKEGEEIQCNQCKAGIKYALEELTNPTRNITTSIKMKCGSMLSVKTEKPIPKGLIMDAVKVIHEADVTAPVKIGDIIIVLDCGVNIIATRDFI